MAEYVPFTFIVTMMIVVGWRLVKRSKANPGVRDHQLFRWAGYGLICMTVLLIAVGIVQFIDERSHSWGH